MERHGMILIATCSPTFVIVLVVPCSRLFCCSWSSYKVDHKRDKIGVFVSTVSTKIPFKVIVLALRYPSR